MIAMKRDRRSKKEKEKRDEMKWKKSTISEIMVLLFCGGKGEKGRDSITSDNKTLLTNFRRFYVFVECNAESN